MLSKRLVFVRRTVKVLRGPGGEYCVLRSTDYSEVVVRIEESGEVTTGSLGSSLIAREDLRRTDSNGLCHKGRRNGVVFLLSTIVLTLVVARTARDGTWRGGNAMSVASRGGSQRGPSILARTSSKRSVRGRWPLDSTKEISCMAASGRRQNKLTEGKTRWGPSSSFRRARTSLASDNAWCCESLVSCSLVSRRRSRLD